MVRVKGGVSDYYVLARVDYAPLRLFHRTRGRVGRDVFKPLPIGFRTSKMRADVK
jgi:hypothetical protein